MFNHTLPSILATVSKTGQYVKKNMQQQQQLPTITNQMEYL